MKRFVVTSVALAFIAFTPRGAHAGASVFGFSVGEDTMTLSAILAQAIQQTSFLSDLASFSRDMGENIAFVRDVYETGNDVINANWEDLGQQFLFDVAMSDRHVADIYRNTEAMISGRGGRGRGFRRLIDAGLGQMLFETFGPYPFGPRADQYALSDYRSMNLNALADEAIAISSDRSRMIKEAWDDCLKGLDACEHATGKMNALQAALLQQQLTLQAEQAKAHATDSAIRNAERKARDRELQLMQRDVVRGLSDFGTSPRVDLYNEEDFE